MFEYTEAQGQRRPPMQRSYTSGAPANYALSYPDGPSHSRSNSLDVSSGSWPAQWEQSQGPSGSSSSASWLVSPSNVFTHPRSAPTFDPVSLNISSPPTPASNAPSATSPSQELEQLRQRARELEIINQFATARVEELEKERALYRQRGIDGTPPITPDLAAEWEARTEARKRQYCSPNRAGNACKYIDLFGSAPPAPLPPLSAPPEKAPFTDIFGQCVHGTIHGVSVAHTQHLNCGCTFNEALFEQALAAHGVGSYYPGESVRMDPALRTPLLKLLEWRYGYRDGDFDRDPVTGQWITQWGSCGVGCRGTKRTREGFVTGENERGAHGHSRRHYQGNGGGAMGEEGTRCIFIRGEDASFCLSGQ
ncbi:hypothetical protein AG1IA_09168 [Rhizoctonia solani AG-1 IA]|uniref:Uncharacterized protein n=1 Tax=Thanatephorus cucumeris (strain AG1-IA) TaxID=983506 RepID=L8WF64_THACA|nr:hypothetical protein AG1IA_09168 [Rhizoctonia solani AG-1 IA]